MSDTWGTVYQMERDKALGIDADSLRREVTRLRNALTDIQTLAVASGAALTFATMSTAHTQIDKITRAALRAAND